MKTALTLALALTSTIAFANNPRVFTGKYVVEHGNNCSVDVGYRAYVSIEKYKGIPEITINFYGDEARIMSFPTVSNVSEDSIPGGKVTRDTKVLWPMKNVMKSKTVSSGVKYGRKLGYVQESMLSLKGSVLTVVEMLDGREEERCVLLKK